MKADKIVWNEVVKSKISVLKYGASFDDGRRYGDDLRYWSNSCGELHHWGQYDISEDELPKELKKLYHTLWAENEFGLYCYLAEFRGQYGIALIAEYHEYEPNGTENACNYAFAKEVSEKLSEWLPKVAPKLPAQILLAREQGFPGDSEQEDPATELVLFMGHEVSEEDYKVAGKLFGRIAYELEEKLWTIIPVNICVRRYYRVYVRTDIDLNEEEITKLVKQMVVNDNSELDCAEDPELEIEEDDVTVCSIDHEGSFEE